MREILWREVAFGGSWFWVWKENFLGLGNQGERMGMREER
jgi:hypothetical protein